MYFLRRRDHLVQNQDDTIQSWGLKDLPVLLRIVITDAVRWSNRVDSHTAWPYELRSVPESAKSS